MRRLILAVAASVILDGLACAQSVPDLTGFWERRDDSGSGSFGGIDAKIPKAVLVPGLPAPEAPPNSGPVGEAPHKPGEPYVVTTGRCGGGMPFMMGHSAAIDIVQTSDEILIIPEMPGTRHIYMDGRPHPALNASTRSPTPTSTSITRILRIPTPWKNGVIRAIPCNDSRLSLRCNDDERIGDHPVGQLTGTNQNINGGPFGFLGIEIRQ